jgi:hypothetical protein
MAKEIPSLVLCVHPGYGNALRVQRLIPDGSVVFPFGGDVRTVTPTATSLQVGIDEHIDGPPTMYLNHSCEPNVFADASTSTVVAIRDIQPGEDIQSFYPANEWHLSVPFKCACGTTSCLGLISGAREMDHEVLGRYRLNDHIKLLCGYTNVTGQLSGSAGVAAQRQASPGRPSASMMRTRRSKDDPTLLG